MIGVFGGTFDPPHLGHLILAEEGRFQLRLERILWVLTLVPPHKPDAPISPLDARMRMLREAIRGIDYFEISRADIDRPGPHYAVGTMNWLAERYPQARFLYLMGGDSLRDLVSWHDPMRFLQVCDAVGVMERPGADIPMDKLEEDLPGIHRKLRFFKAPLIEISGREIRKRVREGQPYRHFIPDGVAEIIEGQGLYR
jgi:nicotinate-nucleotide adenylyltransferase